MKDRKKWIAAIALIAAGAALIAWNLRNPNLGSPREVESEQALTLDQVPPAVKATLQRESAGGTIKEIQREGENGKTTYEVEIVKGATKIELTLAEDGSALARKVKQK